MAKIPVLSDYGMEYNEDYVNVLGTKYAQLVIRASGNLCCKTCLGYKEGYKPYAHYKPTIDEEKQYLEMVGYADTEKYVLFVYKPISYVIEENTDETESATEV